jgi:hypothetical protein
MQLAQTRGLQQANQRGLLNSSMAVGAAQDSVLNAATPIAQFDADINAKAAGYNAETANTFTKTNAAFENDAKNFGAQSINRANEFNASNEYNKQQALFEANVKASLQQIDNEAQFDKQSQNIYGGLGQEFTRAMLAINQDTNMDQQSKDYALKQMFDAYKSQVSMLSAVGSIPDVGQLLIAEQGPAAPPPVDPNANTPKTKANFDPKAYLARYPDLAQNAWAKAHPWEHYQKYGSAEGRSFTYKAA